MSAPTWITARTARFIARIGMTTPPATAAIPWNGTKRTGGFSAFITAITNR
jgi:hypothetical protein